MDPVTITFLILGFGGIGFAIRVDFKTTKQISEQTTHLTFLIEAVLKAMQNSGLAELRLDDDQHVIGLNVTVGAQNTILRLLGHIPEVKGTGEVKNEG